MAIAVFFGQIILSSGTENIISNFLALIPFLAADYIIFQPFNQKVGRALTGAAVFLAIAANSIAPMIGTLSEGHIITFSLIDPINTYFHRCLFAFAMLAAHSFSLLAVSSKPGKLSDLGALLGAKVSVSPTGIWALGFLGLCTFLLKILPLPQVLMKILDGFGFLMWIPYLLLIPPYSKGKIKRKNWLPILLYYLFGAGLSLASNSRMGMVGPIATVGAAWLVSVLCGYIQINAKLLKRAFYLMIVGVFAIGVLGDFSTAILIERSQREIRTPEEQLAATFERFFDKEAIANYHTVELEMAEGISAENDWQENYVRNSFLARFVQIKFDDNCLQRVSLYGEFEKDALWESSINKLLAQVPDPFLKPLNIEVDKKFANSYSTGDMIEVLSGKGFLGGRRTGSIPAHAYALFDWWYIVAVAFIYFLLFFILQKLISTPVGYNNFNINFSTLGLLLAFKLYTDMSLDGVTDLISILIRGLWQTLLIYGISIWFIGKFINLRMPQSPFPVNFQFKRTYKPKVID